MSLIAISIGDWSGDGHGKHKEVWFSLSDGVSVQDAREAFFKSVKDYPLLDPTTFASEYQDDTVPDKVIAAAKEKGFVIDEENFYVSEMASYVAWFIGLSGLVLTPAQSPDTLHFYGHDKKRRHIGFVGYGLFCD